jgi:membrane-bound lytic murein transglycosylase MltF
MKKTFLQVYTIFLNVLLISLLFLSLPSYPNTAQAASATPALDLRLQISISDEGSKNTGAELLANPARKADFKSMASRRQIRVLVVHNKLFYFLDGGRQRGLTYEAFTEFEKHINMELDSKHLKVNILFIPVTRDQLLPALIAGLGDIATANLTITPERQALVDFSDPLLKNVREVLVTSRDTGAVTGVDDLSGKMVHVRLSSSYYQSIVDLNEKLALAGKPPVKIEPVDEHLEDSDLLEMVNVGLISRIVVDSHKAAIWKQVFPNIVVHSAVVLRDNAKIGWAFRKNSPQLEKVLNAFVKINRKGSLFGNIIYNRYLKDNRWIRNPLVESERRKLESMIELFQHYGKQYSFDWLMLAALGYQESTLDQSKRSSAGAIGVMQVLKSTANDAQVSISKIEELDNNIHAGTKYLHVLQSTYLSDEDLDPLNKTLLTFASYNAGPNKIRSLRKQAGEAGFDPSVWFGNVEVLAARRIGRETVQYVSNIYKYYIAYQKIVENLVQHKAARKVLEAE